MAKNDPQTTIRHPLKVADSIRHTEDLKHPFPLDEAADTIDKLYSVLKDVWDELEYDPTNWMFVKDKVKEAIHV